MAQFPDEYDWEDQARVIGVWRELDRRAGELLPDLLEHLDDPEYCVTYSGLVGHWRNYSVGEICRTVALTHLRPYSIDPRQVRVKEPWSDFKGGIRKWYLAQPDHSLAALQRETLQFVRVQIRELDEKVLEPEKRNLIDRDLTKLIEQIESTGVPIARSTSKGDGIEFKNYPLGKRRNRKAVDRQAEQSEERPKTISALIDALANSNEVPKLDDSGKRRRAIFPENYDFAEQAKVIKAWDQLHERTEEALPELVAHGDDERYAITLASFTGAWSNCNVGFVCRHILQKNVQPFDKYRFPLGGFPSKSGELESWWNERERLSLKELQLESIRAAQEECRKRMSTGKITRADRGRISEEDLRELNELEEKILKTGEAISLPVRGAEEFDFETYPLKEDGE